MAHRKSALFRLLLWLVCQIHASGDEGTAAQQKCRHGLELHGRGRWKEALSVFADTVVQYGVDSSLDCIFGAGLSYNTLGASQVGAYLGLPPP
jgi:hypothetical protein